MDLPELNLATDKKEQKERYLSSKEKWKGIERNRKKIKIIMINGR